VLLGSRPGPASLAPLLDGALGADRAGGLSPRTASHATPFRHQNQRKFLAQSCGRWQQWRMSPDLPEMSALQGRYPARSVALWHRGSALLALALLGCDGTVDALSRIDPPALLHSTMASTAYGVAQSKWSPLPVPPEDGP